MKEIGKIAVILVNYNGIVDTLECLNSIQKSNYEKIEVYVTDNNSSDESVKKLIQYKENYSLPLHILPSKKNLGFSGGNNLALKKALVDKKTQYFLLLNNDTLIREDCISELVQAMEEGEISTGKIMYAYDRNRIWYAGGNVNRKTLKPSHDGYNQISDIYDSKRYVTFVTGCCVCMSRKCLEAIGLWNEDFFLYEEDVEYSIRALNEGFKMVYNPRAIIYHKVGASSGKVSGLSEFYQVRNRYWLIKKHLKGCFRAYAYVYTFVLFLNRIRKAEYSIEPMLKGIEAFNRGEVGKHEGAVN